MDMSRRESLDVKIPASLAGFKLPVAASNSAMPP